MRTVAGGTITQALIDTQSDANKTPYIKVYINSTDYFSRLEYLEHHEEPYRDRAVIGLNNRDGTLDAVDLDGQEFEIGYGYDSSGNGGSATDKVDTPTMWVKSHQIISVGGERIYQIYAEGMWMYLREMSVLPGFNIWKASKAYVAGQVITPTTPNGHSYQCSTAGTSGASEPTWPTGSGDTVADGSAVWTEIGTEYIPYSSTFNRTHTVEELMQLVIEAMGWTWTAVSNSDGIIDDFKPLFDINQTPFEVAASILYRLLWMTKSYLRAKLSKTFEVVYPQTSDDVDETYYSNQAPYFEEYDEKTILLIPNSIVVLAGLLTDGTYSIIGTDSDATQIAKYHEVIQPYLAASIDSQVDADNRASAILTRIRAEILGGRLTLPFHDCRVELYDKVLVDDART